MIRRIVEKELLETGLSRSFLVLVVLSVALVALSLYTGISQYSANARYHTVAQELMRETVPNQVSWDALASWGEYRIYRPPSTLAVLANGLEDATGRSTPISAYDEPALSDSKYNEHPILAVFGDLDFMLIIRIVFSLLALLFTYNAICGEREQGTLKLMLVNPIPRDQILIGKLVGGVFGVGAPLLVSVLVATFLLLVQPEITLTFGEWTRLAAFFVLCFLYVFCFLNIGLLISAVNRRSAPALLMALVVWVFVVLVAPKAALITAASTVEVPTSAEVQEAKEQAGRQSYRELRAWIQKYQRENGVTQGDVPPELVQSKQKEIGDVRDRTIARIDESYVGRQQTQESVARLLGRLSPAGCLSFAAMRLADTGLDRKRRFLDAARNHQDQFRDWVQRKAREARKAENGRPRRGRSRLDVADMPSFTMPETSTDAILAAAAPDFAIILFVSILCFFGAYVAVRRYDPR